MAAAGRLPPIKQESEKQKVKRLEKALGGIVKEVDADTRAASRLLVGWPKLVGAIDEARSALAWQRVTDELLNPEPEQEQEKHMSATTSETGADVEATGGSEDWGLYSVVVLQRRGARTDVSVIGPTSSKKVADLVAELHTDGSDSAIVVKNERPPKMRDIRSKLDIRAGGDGTLAAPPKAPKAPKEVVTGIREDWRKTWAGAGELDAHIQGLPNDTDRVKEFIGQVREGPGVISMPSRMRKLSNDQLVGMKNSLTVLAGEFPDDQVKALSEDLIAEAGRRKLEGFPA